MVGGFLYSLCTVGQLAAHKLAAVVEFDACIVRASTHILGMAPICQDCIRGAVAQLDARECERLAYARNLANYADGLAGSAACLRKGRVDIRRHARAVQAMRGDC